MNGVPMFVSEDFKDFVKEVQTQRKKVDKDKPKSKMSYTELTDVIVHRILNKPRVVDLLLTARP